MLSSHSISSQRSGKVKMNPTTMADALENVQPPPISPSPPISPPPDGFMQKFQLYATQSKFYMVGRDKSRTYWKVLKIGRTEPTELNIREDPTTYTERECSDLLRRIHEGNRVTGGLKFVFSCYGIVGTYKLRVTSCYGISRSTKTLIMLCSPLLVPR